MIDKFYQELFLMPVVQVPLQEGIHLHPSAMRKKDHEGFEMGIVRWGKP